MEQEEEAEKHKLGEGFVGEGSSMNITEQEKEMDADTESLSDWQSAWDGYFKERRKEADKGAVTPLRISKHSRALNYHDAHNGRQVFSQKRGNE